MHERGRVVAQRMRRRNGARCPLVQALWRKQYRVKDRHKAVTELLADVEHFGERSRAAQNELDATRSFEDDARAHKSERGGEWRLWEPTCESRLAGFGKKPLACGGRVARLVSAGHANERRDVREERVE